MSCPRCGDRINKDLKTCPNCGAELKVVDDKKEGDFPKDTLYYCPVCNKGNKIKDTFKCPSCETEYLCLEHRVKRSVRDPVTKKFITDYYCTNCWKTEGFATFSD